MYVRVCLAYTHITHTHTYTHATHTHIRTGQPSGPSGGFSTNSITGIIIAIVFVLFFLVPLGYYFGRDYWRKRHQYSWYNTLTSPGEWCDCDCCSSPTPERSFALQRNVTTVNEPVSTEPAAEVTTSNTVACIIEMYET